MDPLGASQSPVAHTHIGGKQPPSESTLSHLLKSNHPPTLEEEALTHTVLNRIRSDIAAIDGEIARARAVVDGLLCKREAMEAKLNEHARIFSTLRRVPPEILSQIFLFCLSGRPVEPHDYFTAPRVLGLVCNRWRYVARTTPELYTCFHFLMTDASIKADAIAAKTWLSRSGELPLFLIFGTSDDIPSPLAHTILDDIFMHCHRWKEITLFLPHDLVAQFATIKGRTPSLEYLGFLSAQERIDVRIWPLPLDAFQDAPLLKSLYLDGGVFNVTLNLAWHALTELRLDDGLSTLVMPMLRDCLSLETLEISDIEDGYPTGHLIVELPNLHTLNLTIDTISYHIFAELKLPALRHLVLHLCPYPEEPGGWSYREEFLSLLSRSKCSIQSLQLVCEPGSEFSEVDLIACLEAVPSLTKLHIRDDATYALTRAALHRMTYREGKAAALLAPHLQTLKIDWRRGAFEDAAFAGMVASRCAIGPHVSPARTSLQVIEIDIFPPEDEDEDDFEANMMKEDGFEPRLLFETLRVLRNCKLDCLGMTVKVIEVGQYGEQTDWLRV
ncbi:hypothetical protein HWV62_31551 [Athelia sp. TMB]|nr:hypothetical protein HWV62_31551 [Athelia sp. TMB]